MPGLLDLPPELVLKIAERLRSFPQNSGAFDTTPWLEHSRWMAGLSRTCKRLHSICNPSLYRSLLLTCFHRRVRNKLLRTIIESPELARHVKNLSLSLTTVAWPPNTGRDNFDPRIVSSLENIFFPQVLNLTELSLNCTTRERISLDFQKLTRAYLDISANATATGFSQEIVKRLLLAPKMETLALVGDRIPNGQLLDNVESDSSNVSHLRIEVEDLSAAVLHNILRLPRRLTSLDFSCGFPCRNENITFADIETAIYPQRESLKRIEICLPDDRFNVTQAFFVYGGLSFQQCTGLDRLTVAPEMFLGWQLCDDFQATPLNLVVPTPTNTARDPTSFAACLPDQIRELTLVIEPYQRRRNGDDYLYDVLRSVIDEARLNKLDSINLEPYTDPGGTAFCAMCFVEASVRASDWPSMVPEEVISDIQRLCLQKAIVFNYDQVLLE